MSVLDIILLVCFIPALITGISKGFIQQAAGLASVILGTWLAFKFSEKLSVLMAPGLNLDEKWLHVISFAIILIITILLLALVGKILSGVLELATLGWVNRVLGFIFAIFKAALLLGLVISIFENFNARWELVRPELLEGSPVYIALKGFALKVLPYLKSLIVNA